MKKTHRDDEGGDPDKGREEADGEPDGGSDEGDESEDAEHGGSAEEEDGKDGGRHVGLGLLDVGDNGLDVGLGSAGVGSDLCRGGVVVGLQFQREGQHSLSWAQQSLIRACAVVTGGQDAVRETRLLVRSKPLAKTKKGGSHFPAFFEGLARHFNSLK